MMATKNLPAARRHLDEMGGWLLHMGDGHYLATDDEGLVRDLRSPEFIAECEAAKCWDETRR